MVGGEQAQYRERLDLFQCMGKTIIHVGGPGAGHAVKALNNYVSAAGLIATVEALLVGQAFGLDPTIMTDVLNTSTGRNNTTENKVVQFMLSVAFDSGFSLQLMAKDIGTAMDLGESLGLNMRLAQQLLGVWSDAARALEPSADHTEMYRYLQEAGQ
jgi:3-hydroxyisobutyrate dehydrogenase